LGIFGLISLFYAVIGIGVIRQVIQRRKQLFDHNFTFADRALIDQAAFFILVPISVALHELGHAIAVWFFGGEVTDFGFYVFAGYVSHQGRYTNDELILIALAGPFVNVILSLAAVAIVLLWKPPMRAAYNELLIEFAVISGINALIFYPMLDIVATGLEGDWTQIYRGGDPALSWAIGILHVGILAGSFWLSRYPPFRRRLAALTGLPPGSERGLLGRSARVGPAPPEEAPPVVEVMKEATNRIASGWPVQLEGRIQPAGDQVGLWLLWRTAGMTRGVTAITQLDGGAVISGFAEPTSALGRSNVQTRPLSRMEGPFDANDLVLQLRVAMEQVESWPPQPYPGAEPAPASGNS
jgi:hypothetical protein